MLRLSLALALGCREAEDPPGNPTPSAASAEAGWDALRYGDYVGSGVPADVWFDLVGADESNLLEREGRSADVPSSFNLFAAPNGVEVVGGITCFGCHGAWIDGRFYPGIGDPRSNFVSDDGAALFDLIRLAVDTRYGADSPESEAYEPLARGSAAVSPYTVTPFAGVNPAFSLERAAVAHRDPATLEWVDEPVFPIPAQTLWCDVPPLWNADRKTRLYWTGFGAGVPERMLMQIGVVGLTDVDQAEQILEDFDDIRAWMAELEPPPFPDPVDPDLAAVGEAVFAQTCAECHGTYGDGATWPERFVPAAEVGTDPTYAEGFVGTDFMGWMAESWFGEGASDPGALDPGYVAPPLDGIWATAPYLHNGSVPDLVALLDPAQRPPVWRRDPVDSTLDHARVGWPYTVPDVPDEWTYDTSAPGADHGGHLYGAALSETERTAVLEYLKTL